MHQILLIVHSNTIIVDISLDRTNSRFPFRTVFGILLQQVKCLLQQLARLEPITAMRIIVFGGSASYRCSTIGYPRVCCRGLMMRCDGKLSFRHHPATPLLVHSMLPPLQCSLYV